MKKIDEKYVPSKEARDQALKWSTWTNLNAEEVVVDVLPVPPPLKLGGPGGPGGPAGGPPAPLVKLKPGGGIGLWLVEV